VLTVTLVLVYYMNFKYGFSQAPELGGSVPREVRDRDYFYIWSYSTWGVWVALGLVLVWESVATLVASARRGVGEATAAGPPRRSWLVASPVLLVALLPLVGNWDQASRAGETATRDFAHDLLNSVEPYGVLVTVGDNDTFPLWYAQEVEGIRRDVTVAVTSLLNTDWYVRGIIRRPVHEYDAARGPAVYRGRQWPKPTAPALSLTIEQADAVPLFLNVQDPQRFVHAGIEAVVDPRQLQYGVIERADLLVLQMIKDNYGRPGGRPLYISRTAGGYGQALGLQPYLLTQGLARRVMPGALTPGRDTLLVEGEGFVDVPRTRSLWSDVFAAPESIVSRGDWVDRPSANIPAAYVTTGLVLGDALARSGQAREAGAVLATAQSVATASRTASWFFSGEQSAPPTTERDAAPRVTVPADSP
jgi:hypothetical protein